MHEELLGGFVGAVGERAHEVKIFLVLERFAGGTVLNPVFVIAAKAFGALDHGDDGTQKPDDCKQIQQRNVAIATEKAEIQD